MTRRQLLKWTAATITPTAAVAALAWSADHHARNFHTVEPHVLYRSGQLTATGLEAVLRVYEIKTVVTLRGVRDPNRPFLDDWEKEICAKYNARYVRIVPRAWTRNNKGELSAEEMVREFRAIMDNRANYPVLVHCFAGIHRTGTMCAVYRVEYNGWSADRAIAEMEGYGFEPGQSREAIDSYLRAHRSKRAAPL